MPKVFLVKRRSPGVSVRSWDELPDEERADTYIPGERRAGAGPGRGTPGVGAGGAGSPRLLGEGWAPHRMPPLLGWGRSRAREDRVRGWRTCDALRPLPPSGRP